MSFDSQARRAQRSAGTKDKPKIPQVAQKSSPNSDTISHSQALSSKEFEDDVSWQLVRHSRRKKGFRQMGAFSLKEEHRDRNWPADSREEIPHLATNWEEPLHLITDWWNTDGHSKKLNGTGKAAFIPDNTRNTKPRPMMSTAALKASYKLTKANYGAVLPSFTVSRASLHYMAPAHVETPFYWTRLEDTEEAFRCLQRFVHGSALLSSKGYRTCTSVRGTDLERYKKCGNCGKTKKTETTCGLCHFHSDKILKTDQDGRRFLFCCDLTSYCQTRDEHDWDSASPVFDDHFDSFILAPQPTESIGPNSPRRAIVTDCEMVGVAGNISELARLCAVDYLTGEVLIDAFINPTEPIKHWRTRWSGIKSATLRAARKNGNCLLGWRAARDVLLKIMNSETILVGAALQNDLNVLRLVHTNIVDASLVAMEKVNRRRNLLALWNMSKSMLDLDIQASSHSGHDPLEDCMAAREITLWMTYLGGSDFDMWAAVQRGDGYINREQFAKEQELLTGAWEE